jgi:hypothetical protein
VSFGFKRLVRTLAPPDICRPSATSFPSAPCRRRHFQFSIANRQLVSTVGRASPRAGVSLGFKRLVWTLAPPDICQPSATSFPSAPCRRRHFQFPIANRQLASTVGRASSRAGVSFGFKRLVWTLAPPAFCRHSATSFPSAPCRRRHFQFSIANRQLASTVGRASSRAGVSFGFKRLVRTLAPPDICRPSATSFPSAPCRCRHFQLAIEN